MLHPFFSAPLAFLYGLVIDIRHKLFDTKVLKSEEFDIPIVCVGNLTVGGTGKTPVTEFLVEHLSADYNVAVISRGYRRKTKGFVLATTESSFRAIGDEPKQIKLKYPHIPVAVCEKRVEGIKRLREIHPEVNLIILDDAFQHRYVESWVNIVLMDYNNPIYKDKLLPWGRLRDRRSQIARAHIVLVTKCPENVKPLDLRLVNKYLDLFPYQSLYFSRMIPAGILPLFPDRAAEMNMRIKDGNPVIVMTGLANPASFINSVGKKYKIVNKLIFEDHHTYRMRDMAKLEDMLKNAPESTFIVITEKDAVKLTNGKKIPLEVQKRLYYMPITVSFLGDTEDNFLSQVNLYVRTNQKYSLLHP